MFSEGHYQFDLHAHTKPDKGQPQAPEHPGFSRWAKYVEKLEMSPEELVKLAKEEGLDGIAVTDHETTRSLERALNAAEKEGIIVVSGIEFMARTWLGLPHILGLGLDPDLIKDEKLPYMGDFSGGRVKDIAKWIHDHGGLCVAAHPWKTRGSRRFNMPNHKVKTNYAKGYIDAVETHTLKGQNYELEEWAKENNIPRLGFSDAHITEQVGIVRTAIPKDLKIEKWQDVIEAIRQNKTEPFYTYNIPPEMMNDFRRPKVFWARREWRKATGEYPGLNKILI